MKKLLVLLLTLCAIATIKAQNISSKHFPEKAKVANKMEAEPVELKSGTIVLLSPNIQMNFSRIQKVDGDWKFVGQVTPGISYNLVIGEGLEQTDGSVQVNPYFSLGAFAEGGVVNNPITGKFVGSFDVGGAIGLYKYISVGAGYDLVNKNPYFCVGATVSLFTFKRGLGVTVLSFK